MSDERERELERRLELVEQARRELGDQVQHLTELLGQAQQDIAWLRAELAKARG